MQKALRNGINGTITSAGAATITTTTKLKQMRNIEIDLENELSTRVVFVCWATCLLAKLRSEPQSRFVLLLVLLVLVEI